MVLFPFALIWIIIIAVWVIRNERNSEEERVRVWSRLRPRRPRDPSRGGPDRSGGRRGSRASHEAGERQAR
jgi:hypothetical protein